MSWTPERRRKACTCKEGPHAVPSLVDNACDRTCKLRDPRCPLHGDSLTVEMVEIAWEDRVLMSSVRRTA